MDTTLPSSHRVPPGVEYEFEIVVNRVLQVAKPDYGQVVNLRVELLSTLRERWREGIDLGMTTENAQDHAIVKFGDPKAVGDALREQWLKRLLYHERGKPGRWLLIVCAYLFANMLTVADMLAADFDTYEGDEALDSMAFLLGTYLLVVYAFVALLIIRLRPQISNRLLRWLISLRHVLWFFPFMLLLHLAIMPLVLVLRTEPFLNLHGMFDFIFSVFTILTIPTCWLACYAFWREMRAKPQ